MKNLVLRPAHLTHLGEEHIGAGTRQIEPKNFQHQVLHPQHLTLVVGVVSDVDELPHVRRVDLLVLAGDEHGGGAHQLQLGSLDRHVGEEPVDVGHGEVEGLGVELVLLAHLHQPVHQDAPHAVADVRLLAHVVLLGHVLDLRLAQVVVDILEKYKIILQ